MKRVAIITMHRVFNVGSMLQAYALQRAVSSLGFDCEIVDYQYPGLFHLCKDWERDSVNFRGRFRKIWKVSGGGVLMRSVKFLLTERKMRSIRRNLTEFLVCTKRWYSHRTLSRALPAYDIYLTGSDQVWNPKFSHGDVNFFWGFTEDDCIRISYGASFGTTVIPDSLKNLYADLLRRFKIISVREGSAVDVVKMLTGRDARHVLDPTFLLNQEEWRSFADEAIAPSIGLKKGRYAFVYLMDYSFNPFPEINKIFLELLKAFGLDFQIVLFGSNGVVDDSLCEHVIKVNRFLLPREFLRLMLGAEIVVSNSFHGVAFAANLHKRFIAVLNPIKTTDDRVGDFLDWTGLTARGVRLGKACGGALLARQGDDEFSRLEFLRRESFDFLKSALHAV